MPIKDTPWDTEYRARYFASPRVQIHLDTFRELARQPKSAETRQKMSESHRNKQLSDEHRARLSESQRARHQLRRELARDRPDLTLSEQWQLVREHAGKVSDHTES